MLSRAPTVTERARHVAWARKILNTLDDANDAVQEAYLRAHRNGDTFRPDAPGMLWIITRCSIDAIRRRQNQRTRDIVDEEEGFSIESFACPKDGLATVLDGVHSQELLAQMDDVECKIFYLLAGGYTYEAAATELGIGLAYAKTRVHRARERLRNQRIA